MDLAVAYWSWRYLGKGHTCVLVCYCRMPLLPPRPLALTGRDEMKRDSYVYWNRRPYGGRKEETVTKGHIRAQLFVCISLTADGPQRARLPIPPTATLLSCLWSRSIFSSLPGSRLMNFYRDASSALLQLVNHWLSFTCKPCFDKNRTHDFRTSRGTRLPTRPLG